MGSLGSCIVTKASTLQLWICPTLAKQRLKENPMSGLLQHFSQLLFPVRCQRSLNNLKQKEGVHAS